MLTKTIPSISCLKTSSHAGSNWPFVPVVPLSPSFCASASIPLSNGVSPRSSVAPSCFDRSPLAPSFTNRKYQSHTLVNPALLNEMLIPRHLIRPGLLAALWSAMSFRFCWICAVVVIKGISCARDFLKAAASVMLKKRKSSLRLGKPRLEGK